VLRRLLDSPNTYFTLAGLLFLVLIYTQFEYRPPPREIGKPEQIESLRDRDDVNVIFILIDTLRADRLHSYGYPRETSPFLDHLADTGIRFQHTVSQSSWTKASMASLWTAAWPNRNGVLRWSHSLPAEALMPAEIFQQAGFTTAGIWRNGWVAPNFGFAQGFDTYLRPAPGRSPQDLQRRTVSSGTLLGTDEDLTMAATEFLNAWGHKRFFLYMHYMDVHQYVYDEASAKFGTSYSDVYDNSIRWVDRNVGAVLEELQKRDLQRRTLIVIGSDHGEGFREHGHEGHARTLYREVAEVPFIISLPFALTPGIVVDEVVANVDIWPTVLDLLGLPPIEGADGQSLVPLILAAARGEKATLERPAYAHLDRAWGRPSDPPDPLVTVTTEEFRAFQATAPGKESVAELYDRATDPWEKDNVAPKNESGGRTLPPEVAKLVQDYLALPPVAWGSPTEVELNEMELNQLRALGYVIK
jgi:arylsulfatase A-like enzyme